MWIDTREYGKYHDIVDNRKLRQSSHIWFIGIYRNSYQEEYQDA